MPETHTNGIAGVLCIALAACAHAQASDFATIVIDYQPAPGQLINDPLFSDPQQAIGAPVGGGAYESDNSKLVTLGAFGGSITLGFDQTVLDDARNPMGLDAIVFGNAFYVSGNANRRWAEPAHIEISRDVNDNGLADDPWYVIPGSHITSPAAQWATQEWDDDAGTPIPPEDVMWYPDPQFYPWIGSYYVTGAFQLPTDPFNDAIVENPLGLDATEEGYFGYADCSPVMVLPDGVLPEAFYTIPDDPFVVGITEGSAGGDAFDIAWAIDPITSEPADLDGFDFIRITTATSYDPHPFFGEKSTEVGGVADVRPTKTPGDINGDGVVDQADLGILLAAYGTVPGDEYWNEDADLDGDECVGQTDLGILLAWYGL
ncbi:MAG: hypothetical protein KAS72_07130 [Phycisphaerales bacterium]|nr:hypothetical protein [Phycisphaerales bacterium]